MRFAPRLFQGFQRPKLTPRSMGGGEFLGCGRLWATQDIDVRGHLLQDVQMPMRFC